MRSDVPQLLAGADLFVFPTHYEPYGLVVTEAMACGLPAVVTRCAGSAGAVEHGESGWLLDDGLDFDELLASIDHFSDPVCRRSAGDAARAAVSQWTWDRMTDAYEQLLRERGSLDG
jgi:glycosyltransferase involved in cell wall biosynthesis